MLNYLGDALGTDITGRILARYDHATPPQSYNPGFGTWWHRWAYRVYVEEQSVEAAWAIVDQELCAVLGLTPSAADPHDLRGAFCIPTTPRGIWWPAFLAVDDAEQDRYIAETKARGYTFGVVQVSGRAYGDDYPLIMPDPAVLLAGLQKMKTAGLVTILAFDDTRWPNLQYLERVLAPCAPLIDWCMGIFEVNSIVKDSAVVLDLLTQTRAMLPHAKLAVHFTDLVQSESYGLVNWRRAKNEAGLNALFFQASGWEQSVERIDNRVQDFTRRLMGGMHGYPILSDGVYLFELSTTKTYRYLWTEAQGVALTDALMRTALKPDGGVMAVRPSGFLDGGTP